MKKSIITWSVLLCFCCSCKYDYDSKLKKREEQYEKEGKTIVAKSIKKHFLIYQDKAAFWLDNLDEPARKILSSEKDIVKVTFGLDFNNEGYPSIQPYYDKFSLKKGFFQAEENFSSEVGAVYPYSELELINDEVLVFSYKEICEPYEYCIITSKDLFVYYLSTPDTLFLSKDSIVDFGISDCFRGDYVSLGGGYFQSAINDSDMYYGGRPLRETGIFKWRFGVNNKGDIIETDRFIEYRNEKYSINSLRFDTNDFSSKEEALKVSQTIKDTIFQIQKNYAIKNALTFEMLSNIYSNEIKAKRDYEGSAFYIKCKLEGIERANGFFDKDGYKYKVKASAYDAFGVWIHGYDMVGYTNDESFIELSYPNEVVMNAILISGSRRKFVFEDCKLLLYTLNNK